MTRYIDAAALKESIDEHVYLVHHGFNETEYGCTQYGIHQIIDDAPTIEAVPQWIPCSERLPEEGEVVLTQAKFKDDVKMAISARVDFNYWTGWGTREIDIVAWMPLPKPYEE